MKTALEAELEARDADRAVNALRAADAARLQGCPLVAPRLVYEAWRRVGSPPCTCEGCTWPARRVGRWLNVIIALALWAGASCAPAVKYRWECAREGPCAPPVEADNRCAMTANMAPVTPGAWPGVVAQHRRRIWEQCMRAEGYEQYRCALGADADCNSR